MNRKLALCVITLLIFLLCFSILFYKIKYENNKKSLSTKQEIFNFIKSIDTPLLCSMSFSITEEQKLDFAINYIIFNIDNYSDKILEFPKEFVYTEQESIYTSIGYIDKVEINKIVYNVFGSNVKNIEDYKFYDISSKKVALVPYMKIHFSFNHRELLNIEELNKNEYKVIIKYTRSLNEKNNEIRVAYYIRREVNKEKVQKLNLKCIEICSSIMY